MAATLERTLLEEIAALQKAGDAHGLAAHYAAEAVVTVIDQSNPPSRPKVMRGKADITAYLEDLCGRDVTHEVGDLVSGERRIAYTVRCRYPDDTRVFCAATARTDDGGRIVDETIVQAWD